MLIILHTICLLYDVLLDNTVQKMEKSLLVFICPVHIRIWIGHVRMQARWETNSLIIEPANVMSVPSFSSTCRHLFTDLSDNVLPIDQVDAWEEKTSYQLCVASPKQTRKIKLHATCCVHRPVDSTRRRLATYLASDGRTTACHGPGQGSRYMLVDCEKAEACRPRTSWLVPVWYVGIIHVRGRLALLWFGWAGARGTGRGRCSWSRQTLKRRSDGMMPQQQHALLVYYCGSLGRQSIHWSVDGRSRWSKSVSACAYM